MHKKDYRTSLMRKAISVACLLIIFAPLGVFSVKGFTMMISIARCMIIIYYSLRHVLQKKKLCKPGILCILLIVYIAFMTIMNDLDIWIYLKNALGVVAFILYSNIEIKDNLARSLKYIEELFAVLLVINIIMVIIGFELGSDLGYPNYLLGMRTRFSDMVYPYLCILLINNYELKKDFRKIVFGISLSLATVIIPAVATAIGSLVLFFVIYYVLRVLGQKSYRVLMIGIIVLSVAIVFFRVQDIFSPIIEGVLHKNVTFTGRTYIWDSALEYISQKPIFGHGYNAAGIAHYWGHLYQPHNQLLDLLANGGLLAVVIFGLFLASVTKRSKTPYFGPAIAMLCAVLFACTFERYARYPLFYIVPFIIYYAGVENEKKTIYKN